MAEKNSQSDTMGEGDSIEDLKLKVAELETSRAKLRQALIMVKEKTKNTRVLIDKHKEVVHRCEELEEENKELKLRVSQEAAAVVKGVPERERQLKTEYEGQISVLQEKLSRADEQVKKARGQAAKGVNALTQLKTQSKAIQEELMLDVDRLERELKASRKAELQEKAARESMEREVAKRDKISKEVQQTVTQGGVSLLKEHKKAREMSLAMDSALQEHWKTMVAIFRAAGFDESMFRNLESCQQNSPPLITGPKALHKCLQTRLQQTTGCRLDLEMNVAQQANGAEDKDSNTSSTIKGASSFEFPPMSATQPDVCPKQCPTLEKALGPVPGGALQAVCIPGIGVSTMSAGSSQTEYSSRPEKQIARRFTMCEKTIPKSTCSIPGIGLVIRERTVDDNEIIGGAGIRSSSHERDVKQNVCLSNCSKPTQNCTRLVNKRPLVQTTETVATKRRRTMKQSPCSSELEVVRKHRVLQTAGSGVSRIEPAVRAIRESISVMLSSPDITKETAEYIIKTCSNEAGSLEHAVAVELSSGVHELSVNTPACVEMETVDSSKTYKALWCEPNSATDRAFTSLLDLVSLLGSSEKCKHVPFLLMRELKGTTLRFLKNEEANMFEVYMTTAAFGHLCRMYHDVELFMGFVSDLLVFAARAAFCIVGVLHALLGAWPEAVGLLPKNDILSKIVPPIVAGLCYTACKPGSEALLPDLNLRVSAQQVLKLGMENNWWSSIEPGASNIEMSECWLLQQGQCVLDGLKSSLWRLKEVVLSNGNSGKKHDLEDFQKAAECLLLTIVSLDPVVSTKVISDRILELLNTSSHPWFAMVLSLLRQCISHMLRFSIEPALALDVSCAALTVIKFQPHEEAKKDRQKKIVSSLKDVLCEAKDVYAIVRSPRIFGQSFLQLADLIDKESLAVQGA